MINKKYVEMLNKKSVIREIFMYGREKAKLIGEENIFDFSLGNPSVESPKDFDKAIVNLIENTPSVKLHGYSPSLGNDYARETIAKSLSNRFGLDYKKEHIFMASGAAGALAHAFRCVTIPGDEIITFAPYFPEYGPYVNDTGAILKVVSADYSSFQINFDEFEKTINEKTMAILINTPNNPSGIVYTTETIKKLSAILLKKQEQYGHDIYIISDEPYREIVFSGVDAPFISKYYDNTICCYSFSKSMSLPGERIGYVAVNPNCKDASLIVDMCGQVSRGIGHNCPTALIQLGVSEVIDQTSDLSVYEKNAEILYTELTKLGFEIVKPGGTFYMFPKALENDAVAFCNRAKEYNLLLVPSNSFGVNGYFRIAYCVPTQKVIDSIPLFKKLAESYKK